MKEGIIDFKDGEPVLGNFEFNPYTSVHCTYGSSIVEDVPNYKYREYPTSSVHSDVVYANHYGISVSTLVASREERKKPVSYTKVTRKIAVNTIAINSDILLQNGFVEDLSTGNFIRKADAKELGFGKLSTIKNVNDPRNQGYNIEDNAAEFEEKCQLYQNYNTPISKKARIFARYLGNITYGSEIETITGYLPDYVQNRYGIVVCRDGSLKASDGSQGSEYTTIPVSGAKGLVSLSETCKEISKRNIIDHHCAFHIHIGNVDTSRTTLVTLYKLILQIQDEIFKMFPYYKIDEQKYAGKEKNYCNKLMRLSIGNCIAETKEEYEGYIDSAYKRIFSFLAEKTPPNKEFNRRNGKHPKAAKWERHNRYFWVNFMNAFFSKRNTIEFRLHTGTTNSQKAINWLFICNAIVKTAMSHSREILTGSKVFTLYDVLSYYPERFPTANALFLREYLNAYVEQRKERFLSDFNKLDYFSKWDIDEDKKYEFTFDSVKDLV